SNPRRGLPAEVATRHSVPRVRPESAREPARRGFPRAATSRSECPAPGTRRRSVPYGYSPDARRGQETLGDGDLLLEGGRDGSARRPLCARKSISSREGRRIDRSEEHTSELQSRENLVCRL